MLRSMKDLEGYSIGATDGQVGHVTDFYFDDDAWVIRYLVVETGSWLSSKKVLISPMSIRRPNWPARALEVAITREQIRHSPDIEPKNRYCGSTKLLSSVTTIIRTTGVASACGAEACIPT